MADSEHLALLHQLGKPIQHDLNNIILAITTDLDLLQHEIRDPIILRRIHRTNASMERLTPLLRATCNQLRPPSTKPSRTSEAVAALQPLLQVIGSPDALRITLAENDPPQALDRAALAQRVLGAALATGREGPLEITVNAKGELDISPEPSAGSSQQRAPISNTSPSEHSSSSWQRTFTKTARNPPLLIENTEDHSASGATILNKKDNNINTNIRYPAAYTVFEFGKYSRYIFQATLGILILIIITSIGLSYAKNKTALPVPSTPWIVD